VACAQFFLITESVLCVPLQRCVWPLFVCSLFGLEFIFSSLPAFCWFGPGSPAEAGVDTKRFFCLCTVLFSISFSHCWLRDDVVAFLFFAKGLEGGYPSWNLSEWKLFSAHYIGLQMILPTSCKPIPQTHNFTVLRLWTNCQCCVIDRVRACLFWGLCSFARALSTLSKAFAVERPPGVTADCLVVLLNTVVCLDLSSLRFYHCIYIQCRSFMSACKYVKSLFLFGCWCHIL